MARRLVYVASALGFAEPTKHWYQDVLLDALREAGFEVFDPWADPDGSTLLAFDQAHAEPEPRRIAALRGINARIGRQNVEGISSADALLAVLDGPDVDSGTAAEIGYATALGKPVVGLRTDLRPAGDNAGAVVNLQVEHFITSSGGAILASLPAAVNALDQRL